MYNEETDWYQNFVCLASRAVTNGSSTFSSELTLVAFAIREAIWYSGIVGLFNIARRIKVKSLSLVSIRNTDDIGK
jgi:hypothetical protein